MTSLPLDPVSPSVTRDGGDEPIPLSPLSSGADSIEFVLSPLTQEEVESKSDEELAVSEGQSCQTNWFPCEQCGVSTPWYCYQCQHTICDVCQIGFVCEFVERGCDWRRDFVT